MLRELKRRWAPVTDQLRALQTDAIARVTTQEGLGVDCTAGCDGPVGGYLLSLWPCHGAAAVGTAPCYNIFPAQQGSIINLADVVEDTDEHNRAIIAKLRPGLHDEFLLSQSVALPSHRCASSGLCRIEPVCHLVDLHGWRGKEFGETSSKASWNGSMEASSDAVQSCDSWSSTSPPHPHHKPN